MSDICCTCVYADPCCDTHCSPFMSAKRTASVGKALLCRIPSESYEPLASRAYACPDLLRHIMSTCIVNMHCQHLYVNTSGEQLQCNTFMSTHSEQLHAKYICNLCCECIAHSTKLRQLHVNTYMRTVC